MQSLRCAHYSDFHAVVKGYLAMLPPVHVEHTGVAIANPVDGDQARMTHCHWQFSIEQMRQQPGLDTPVVVNDFTAPEITRQALEGSDPVCVDALGVFCALLGTAAANLAVTLGALGGIVPRLGANVDRSLFRARFEDKGRFSSYVAAILDAQLRALKTEPGSAILGQIRRARC